MGKVGKIHRNLRKNEESGTFAHPGSMVRLATALSEHVDSVDAIVEYISIDKIIAKLYFIFEDCHLSEYQHLRDSTLVTGKLHQTWHTRNLVLKAHTFVLNKK